MNNDSTLEERLSRSLDQQAHGVYDAPFTFDDVRGRARGIQRRRRGVAAGVVAVVAAIALPVALLAGPGSDKTDGVDPAPRPTTATASVLHDGVLTLPGGRTVEVDLPDGVTEVGVLRDGRIVAPVNGAESGTIRVLAPDGSRIADYPTLETSIVMGVDDQAVAWTGPTHEIQVLETEVAEPVTFPAVQMPGEAVGLINTVLGTDCSSGGCTVLASGDAGVTYDITLDDNESEVATPEPFASVTDVSPDGATWAVTFPPASEDEQYGCVGLYDVASRTVTARSCETSNLAFSPDGRHLTGARGDGGPYYAEVSVLDLDLEVVGTIEHPAGFVSDWGWEDPEHLLVSGSDIDGAAWTLIRVDLDGTVTDTLDGPAAGELPENAQEYLITG